MTETQQMISTHSAIRFEQGRAQQIEEKLVKETRISLWVNDQLMVELMALPEYVTELVTGFLLTECVIHSPEDVLAVEFIPRSMAAYVKLAKPLVAIPDDPVRSVTSGCGKGVTFLSRLWEPFFPPVHSKATIRPDEIIDLVRQMQKKSSLFRQTGGIHTACYAHGGVMIFSCDDIGRHNAVDKIIGMVFGSRWKIDNDGILLTTGRVSSEIVVKAARGRITFLISSSAPTAAAVSLAESLQITLIGFVRGERFNVYSAIDRVIYCDQPD